MRHTICDDVSATATVRHSSDQANTQITPTTSMNSNPNLDGASPAGGRSADTAKSIRYVRLGPQDASVLSGATVFDNPVDETQLAAFLDDPGHEILVALVGSHVIGFASGTVILHPDKPPAFIMLEVDVEESFKRQGIGTALVTGLLEIARSRGCIGTWLATEGDNTAARALYRRAGARETEDIVVYDWDGAMDDP